jgi:DNA polymerase I-like protein with 3'-5' exonuclease and polymerase domains
MDNEGNLQYWEWDVNPFTREVGTVVWDSDYDNDEDRCRFTIGIPLKDKQELTTLIQENDFVLHNTKFDARGLDLSGLPCINFAGSHDTLIGSHVLVSNESHKLKDLAIQYLDISDDDERELKEAVQESRRIARSLGWAIANGPHPHFPAAKGDTWWNYDYWLPRAVARYKWEVEGDPDWAPPGPLTGVYMGPFDIIKDRDHFDGKPYILGHPWWTVLRTYALRDVERTYPLWEMQEEALKKENLWEQYLERKKLIESTYTMESYGVTLHKDGLKKLMKKLAKESAGMSSKCYKLAKGKIDNLNSPKQLTGVLFGNMGVKPVKLTGKGISNAKAGLQRETTDYSTNVEAMNVILERLSPQNPNPYLPPRKRQDAYDFVWNLLGYRAREKSLDYLEEYQTRALSSSFDSSQIVLHPSFNPTGSDTLRFSSSSPNAQNIGKGNKRKDDPVPSLRSVFGPGAGREWYSIDYSNIELRIFAYQSGDEDLINAYNQGFKVHCIFAKLLWEKEYKQCEKDAAAHCKKMKVEVNTKNSRKAAEALFEERYYETLYQWTKNGNFSLIYGAGESKANGTYHHPNAYRLIRSRMPKIDEFMLQKNHEAKTYGYITTLGGYRLWVPPSEPHVAVNYFVQGSAGWCMVLAINRVYAYLRDLNRQLKLTGRGYEMNMTIHDENDFDFPIHKRNTEVITKVGKLMEQSGKDIGVPTPVSIERHINNWAEGEKIAL